MPQPPNLQAMLRQAQEMMAQQQQAQEALKSERVEASAGGGMVKVAMTGDLHLESIAIDPDAVDPEDVEMLQDLVVAAVNEAIRSAQELQESKLGGLTEGFDPMSALDALVQLGDPQVLGIDPVDRRQGAAEHVVAAPVLVRALDRDHVAGLLDDTDQLGVAPLVQADRAPRPLGEVEADLAERDLLLDVADRGGERLGVLAGRAQDVERQPLRRPLADAGQLRELGDEALERGCEH